MLWALLQVDAVRTAVREAAPTLVEFLLADTASRPSPPPAAAPPVPAPRPSRQTVAVEARPDVAPAAFAVADTPPEPTNAASNAASSAVPAPAVPAPAPPAAVPPRQLPMTAVEYTVRPPIEVPLASRRLGEAGTVWLRVRVGRDGSPQQVTLQRSSGYTRLDQQAQDAMRLARFKPQTEGGQPIEWIVTAPLQYEIE